MVQKNPLFPLGVLSMTKSNAERWAKSARIQMARERLGAVGNTWESLAKKHATPITHKQHRTISWLSPKGVFYDAEEFGGSEHRDWIKSVLEQHGDKDMLKYYERSLEDAGVEGEMDDVLFMEDNNFARINTFGGGELDLGFGDEPTKAQIKSIQDLAISRGYTSENTVVDGTELGEQKQLRRRMGLHKLGKLRQRIGAVGAINIEDILRKRGSTTDASQHNSTFLSSTGDFIGGGNKGTSHLDQIKKHIKYKPIKRPYTSGGFAQKMLDEEQALKNFGNEYGLPRVQNTSYKKRKSGMIWDKKLNKLRAVKPNDPNELNVIVYRKLNDIQLKSLEELENSGGAKISYYTVTNDDPKGDQNFSNFKDFSKHHSTQYAVKPSEHKSNRQRPKRVPEFSHTRNIIGEPLTEEQLRESKLRQRIAGLGFRERILNWLKEQPRFKSFDPDSSFVGTVKYDQDNQSMQIELNGKKYDFCNVEERLFDSFSGAGSKGAFFNREIKSLHNCGAW